VAHGVLTLAYSLGLVDNTGVLDGTAVASLNYNFKMVGFVKPGDTICVKSTVVDTKLTSKGDCGVVSSRLETLNQRDEVVAITDTAVMFIV
jgi:acyl dehydratase